MKHLTITKSFLSSSYVVKDDEILVAKSKRKTFFSSDTIIEINEKEFFFEAKGILSDTITIYEDEYIIGKITYDFGGNIATINLINGGIFEYRKTSNFNTVWEIFSEKEILIKIESNLFSNKGEVKIFQGNYLILALGLFLFSTHTYTKGRYG